MVRLKAFCPRFDLYDLVEFQFPNGAIKSRTDGNKKMPIFKALQKIFFFNFIKKNVGVSSYN